MPFHQMPRPPIRVGDEVLDQCLGIGRVVGIYDGLVVIDWERETTGESVFAELRLRHDGVGWCVDDRTWAATVRSAFLALAIVLLPLAAGAQDVQDDVKAERAECLRDRAYEWFTSSKLATRSNEEFAVLSAAITCEATPDEASSVFVAVSDEIKEMFPNVRDEDDLRRRLIEQNGDDA